MDYYGIPKMLYIYALVYPFMYAFCSVSITLVLLIYSYIYKDKFTGFSIKTSKYKKYKKKLWKRKDHGRLERILQDSDKIQKLYNKWMKESNLCVSSKHPINTIEKAIHYLEMIIERDYE